MQASSLQIGLGIADVVFEVVSCGQSMAWHALYGHAVMHRTLICIRAAVLVLIFMSPAISGCCARPLLCSDNMKSQHLLCNKHVLWSAQHTAG